MTQTSVIIENFKPIHNQLEYALSLHNYHLALELALEQENLVKKISEEGPKQISSVEFEFLKRYLVSTCKLRKILEDDIKKLNSKTNKELKRLKGYAF